MFRRDRIRRIARRTRRLGCLFLLAVFLLPTMLVSAFVAHRALAATPTDIATVGALPTDTSVWSMSVAGTTRTFRIHVPASIDQSVSTPLVVMLHGGFGSGKQAEKAYGWDERADAEDFIVAYPDGRNRAWNAGGTCCGKPARDDYDDVGFITAMVNEIGHHTAIDQSRIYATGISNGGILAYRLACETDLFAAIGPDSATLLAPCLTPKPISVIHIHGLDDEVVRFDGEKGSGVAKIDGPPISDHISFWETVDSCRVAMASTVGPVTTQIADCPEGRSVELITIAGAGHQWPGANAGHTGSVITRKNKPSTALNATETIWAFFTAHPKAR